MFHKSLEGTTDELSDQIQRLNLGDAIAVPEAVRLLARSLLPRYTAARHTMTITCEATANVTGTTAMGFISISVMEKH